MTEKKRNQGITNMKIINAIEEKLKSFNYGDNGCINCKHFKKSKNPYYATFSQEIIASRGDNCSFENVLEIIFGIRSCIFYRSI